ncbi:MAG: hypothetical protein ACOC8D_00195 [bacterium]
MAESSSIPPTRLLLPWAVLLALAVVLTLGAGVQRPDYVTPFALSAMYAVVAGAELAVLLVVAPLASRPERPVGLGDLVVLWAMAAPVVVVGWWVSDRDVASVAASQGYLLAAAFAVASYLRADATGRFRSWYWALLGLLGAGAPVLAFVVGDLFDARLTWLYACSPFWVLTRLGEPWRVGWAWAAPFAALLALGWLLHLTRRVGRAGECVVG